MVTASVGLMVGTVSTPDIRTLNSCASAVIASAGSPPTAVGWNCATAMGRITWPLVESSWSVKPLGETAPVQLTLAGPWPELNSAELR